jgi:hypothetical protein
MNLNTCLNCIETYFAVIGVMVLIVWEWLSILKKDTGFKKEVRINKVLNH